MRRGRYSWGGGHCPLQWVPPWSGLPGISTTCSIFCPRSSDWELFSKANDWSVKKQTDKSRHEDDPVPSKTCHLCVLTCVCLPNSCSHYQYQYPVSAPLDKLLLQSAHVSYWLHFWHLGLHLWVDHWHHVRPLPLRDGGAGGQNCWQHGTHASQVSFTIAIIQLRFVWISQYNVVLRNHLFYTITSSKGL